MAQLQFDFAVLGDVGSASGAVAQIARLLWNLDPQDLVVRSWRMVINTDDPVDIPEEIFAGTPPTARHVFLLAQVEAGGTTGAFELRRIMQDGGAAVSLGQRQVTATQPVLYADTGWPAFDFGDANELRQLRVLHISGGPILFHAIVGAQRS